MEQTKNLLLYCSVILSTLFLWMYAYIINKNFIYKASHDKRKNKPIITPYIFFCICKYKNMHLIILKTKYQTIFPCFRIFIKIILCHRIINYKDFLILKTWEMLSWTLRNPHYNIFFKIITILFILLAFNHDISTCCKQIFTTFVFLCIITLFFLLSLMLLLFILPESKIIKKIKIPKERKKGSRLSM